MPSSDPRVRLLHMRDNILLAQSFVDTLSYEAFRADTLRVYAVTRCFEIISEASRRLPDALKARHPAILWKEMAGAGNVYRHDYEDVAARYLWQALKADLPALLVAVEQELADPIEDL